MQSSFGAFAFRFNLSYFIFARVNFTVIISNLCDKTQDRGVVVINSYKEAFMTYSAIAAATV